MASCQDCNAKTATHSHPMMICDKCWASRYSTQFMEGEYIPFRDIHKARLKGLDLWRKEGESNGDWGDRCKAFAKQNQHRRLFK